MHFWWFGAVFNELHGQLPSPGEKCALLYYMPFKILAKREFFFRLPIYQLRRVFLKRFQHVRTVLFKWKLKYLIRMIMKYNSQYIDIKNLYRLLRIIPRLVSWTHSNDSQHLCLEGEACHTKRLNKTQLTHLPYHANHSQMSIAFAHEAALAMERRSVNYQF